MSNSPGVEAPATKQVVVEIAAANKKSLYINRSSDEPASAGLVCGYFACDTRPFNSLLENLCMIKAAEASLAAVLQPFEKRAGSEIILKPAAVAG